jgi:hypothetical protein
MSNVADSIAALEAALQAAGHPLGRPENRTTGLSATETRQRMVELGRRGDPPREVIDLWNWSRGSVHKLRDPEGPRLGAFERLLPGGLILRDPEDTVGLADEYLYSELLPDTPETRQWLPIIASLDTITIYWLESDGSYDGPVPVRIASASSPPVQEYRLRLTSISALLDAMAQFIADGHWVESGSGVWGFADPQRRYGDDWPWLP